MRVTLKSDGLKEAEARIGKIALRASSSKLLDTPQIKAEFQDAAGRKFDKGIAQAGKEWRLRKRKAGLIDRPMQASGAAKQAITLGQGPGASAVIFKTNREGVEFGVKRGGGPLYYVPILAKGKKRNGKVIKRRVVALDKTARENVATIILRRVDDEFGPGR
jgi:hypothetical protein